MQVTLTITSKSEYHGRSSCSETQNLPEMFLSVLNSLSVDEPFKFE